MTGKFLPISLDEYKAIKGQISWSYIKKQRSKWVDFSFEESSIDMVIVCEPRFVVNDICYEVGRQFFIKEGNTTIRLVAGIELKVQ